MIKAILTAQLLMAGTTYAAGIPRFEQVVLKQQKVFNITVENTSGLPDVEALTQLVGELKTDPQYAYSIIRLTVGEAHGTINFSSQIQRETMGMKQELKPSQWASDVGAVIKGATGGISGTATVKVDVSRTEKKPDGTATTTDVKVEITVTAQK